MARPDSLVKLMPLRDRILVVGDHRSALITSDEDQDRALDLVANPLQGIQAAARCDYQGVAVVTQGLLYRLRPIVDALRQVYAGKIVFLCQMVEEPLLRHFIQEHCQSWKAHTDYAITPVCMERLRSLFAPVSEQTPVNAVASSQLAACEQRIRQLEKLATEDDLTGLKNRRYIWEFGKQILDYAKRETAQVTLLVYDIDDFKHYNDVYGHSVGDRILKEAAILMRRCCRGHDVVGRVGGDEFVVFFWDDPQVNNPRSKKERRSAQMEHPSEAVLVAQRFQKELENSELRFLGPGGKGVLTISGGLATFPRDGETIEQLFQQADEALLEAKRSGKNRVYLVGTPQSETLEVDAQAPE